MAGYYFIISVSYSYAKHLSLSLSRIMIKSKINLPNGFLHTSSSSSACEYNNHFYLLSLSLSLSPASLFVMDTTKPKIHAGDCHSKYPLSLALIETLPSNSCTIPTRFMKYIKRRRKVGEEKYQQ